jgi:putative endonuclease
VLRWLYRKADVLRHRARLRGNVAHAWGKRGEDLAHRYLQSKGYTIIGRNYRTRGGTAEVDLIARDGDTVVFVEVKTRATDRFGAPEEAVDREKRRRIVRAASDFLFRTDWNRDRVRFDIVSVLFGETESVEHIRDAFTRTS